MPLKETGSTAKERIMARAKAMQTTNDRKQTQQETRQQPRQAENPLAGATGTPLEKMRGIGGLEDQETRQWNQAVSKMSRAQIERLSGTLDSALQGQKKQLAATEQVFNQLHGQNATEGLREQLTQQQARAKKTEERLNQLNAAREQAIFREYEDLRSSGDFAENSGYRTTANGKEAKMHPLTGTYAETGFGDVYYDYINGNQTARDVVLANDTKAGTTHAGWKDLPEETVATFNYLYATRGKDAAYDYLDRYESRGYTGIESALMGAVQGSGAASAAAALGGLTAGITGDQELKDNNRAWYGRFLKDAAGAKQEHPAAYGAGSVGGSLALLSGVGAAAGAGAAAAGMSAGALGTQTATGALSFAGANALQNAGAAATGYMAGGDYLKGIAVAGTQGMAGSLAGGLVGSGMAGVLRDKGLMTPFMEFVRQTASGMTNATVNQAVGYAAAEEKPSAEDIATGLATAFAFSVLTSAVNTVKVTQAQRANMESAYKAVERGYAELLRGTENMTPEAKAQRAQVILEQTQRLRESVNSQYIAGQQQAVNELNGALDLIEQGMQNYVNGYSAAYEAAQAPRFMLPGAGNSGMLPTAEDAPTGPDTGDVTPRVLRDARLPSDSGWSVGRDAALRSPSLQSTRAAPAHSDASQEIQGMLQTAIRQGMTQPKQIPGAEQRAAAQAGDIMAPQADTARPEASGQIKTASKVEAGTGLVPMTELAEARLVNGKNNIIAKTKDDIIGFVRRALGRKGGPERLYMGTIPDETAAKVFDATGIDVKGYTAILPGDSVQHIFKQHGNTAAESARGQAAVSETDVALIPNVLSAPDSVTLSEKTDVLGRSVLLFSKQIGNEYVTAQAVTDGRHALTTNSLWIKEGKDRPAIHNTGKTGPVDNVQNALPQDPSANVSVAQRGANVNGAVLPTAEDGTGRTLPTADTGDVAHDALRDDRLPSGVDSVNTQGYDEAVTERRTGYEAAGKDQVSDGDGRWVSGEGAGGQNGILAEGGPQRAADTGRAAAERQNTGRALRLEKVSSRDLGLENGTTARTLSILPRAEWDAELQQVGARVEQETGRPVTMVLGGIRITDGTGTVRSVRGVYSDSGIIVQADNLRLSPGQIADHEIFHSYADENPGLIQAVERAIVERYGREEFDGILNRYVKELRGVVDLPENATADEFEDALLDVKNELFADAYAGINAFGAHAEQYQDTVQQTLEERGVVKPGRETAAATDRRTGPPERYSIAELSDGKKYVRADRQVIFGNDPDSWSEQLEDYINGKIRRGEDVTLIGADGDELRLTATSAGKLSDNHTGDGRTMSDEAFERKVNAASHIDELAQVSVRGKKSVRDHNSRHGDMASGGWNYRTAFFEDFDGKYYEVTISVAQNENGNMVYNIGKMQERSIPQISGSSVTNNGALRGDAPVNSISETGRNVNGEEKPAPQKSAPVKTRFSMDEPVEQTKDLIAVHNKDWAVIRDAALNWGGIPSPSVAIVDAAEGHTKYGDTSVVFQRATIDPEADPRNKVYGGDAWTPTKDNALVEREVNYEARRAFDENIKNLSSRFADGVFQGSSTLGKIGLENETRWEPEEIADKLANHPEVQAAYLQSEGKSLEPVYRDKQFDRFFSNETIRRYIDTVGEQEVARLAVKLMTGEHLTAEEMKPAEQAIREVYAEEHANFLNRRPESKEKRIDYYMENNVFKNRVEDFIRNAQEFYESGGSAGEIDKEATAAKMMEMIAPGGSWNDALRTVKDWVQPQLNGLLGERGIYNGKDTVTDSGRRSFAQTHWDYTAENIVKAMNMAADKGANMYGVTPETLAATATREYRNVDEMHADEARLRTVSEEEHAKALRDLGIYLDRVVNDLMLTTMHRYDNTFEEEQNLSGIIAEAAKGKKTTAAVKAAFRKEGYTISDGHAKSILALIDRAANIPTGYYEAKPQRVVDFDEALAVIAPDSVPAEEIAAVRNAGVNVIQYQTGNDKQRMEIANSLKNVHFSVDDEGTGETAPPKKQEKKERRPRTTKPVAESLPIIAKKDFRQNMLNLFSIPAGMRAELGAYADQLADKLLASGELTQADRNAFFDRMYESGVVTMEADEYFQNARQTVLGRRIYVPEGVKHEFGDDWNDFRRQAFAAGVIFTNDRTDNGIDAFNMELSERLPGLFRVDDTDERLILERIVQMAEEGKAEKVSLAEYTAMLAGEEYVSEREVLDNTERQMDWALRTFAEKAKLEIKLRDRTGVKIAQEREKYDEQKQKARDREVARRANEEAKRRDHVQRQRDEREMRELQQKTLKQLQWLNKNRNRAPEELRSRWDDILGDIDTLAIGAANEMNWSRKYGATWGDLAQMYKDAQKNDPNFLPSKELENIVNRLDKTKIADLDMGALQDLYKAAVGLRTEFYNRNNVIGDEKHRIFAEVYEQSKAELQFGADTKAGKNAREGKGLDRLFNTDQLSPMNVMQRMAGWNPNSTFYAMAKQLEKGERDIRAYTVKANQLLRDFLTEHEDWVKKADGQGDDGIWYEVKIPQLVGALEVGKPPKFGDTITVWMTPTQKIHMYLESKNYDNLRHMEGGRIFPVKSLYSQGKRESAFAQGKLIRLAPETVKALVRDLTPEEQELAGLLENYYNQFAAKEINRVSNILYGYDKAVNKNYAPIYADTNYTKNQLGVYDATAEGVGNLKARQHYSKNPSYNIGAFDAFERHVEQTARFVGMAIPARNWNTLLGWNEYRDDGRESMRSEISHTWGDESLKYIEGLIKTLQGGQSMQKDSAGALADTVFSNYISAVFGFNPSIVFKQLGSIPLASAWLGAGNIPSPAQISRIDRDLIAKYTQELDWRTMGYSTPETKQLKDNPNWTQSNKAFAFLFGGEAITAMDGWAASVLWPWAENKVRREYPELETGTQAQIDSGASPFYRKVAEEFNEAVARSQSTSDEMHQGTLRKSKNPVTRAFTMFKSDSSQTYNALRQYLGEAGYYKRTGDKQGQSRAQKAAGAAFIAAVGAYVFAQTVEFLMNLWKHKGKAYRDEDGNLTAESVAREMVTGLMGDLAGIVTGGEEVFNIFDAIGTKLTGGTWYDSKSAITAPGLEQLSDVIETVISSGKGTIQTAKDLADVVMNGGSPVEYLRRHGGDIAGGIKEFAAALATYLPGLPANNLEAYLLGTVRWISPELGTAYEDALATADKDKLSGLKGEALERRVRDILSNRSVEQDENTAAALAELYEAGYKGAVPGDTPGSITVGEESRKLNAWQQQTWDKVWSGTVGDSLKTLTASEAFRTADDETREKMLRALYDYAGEKAKAVLFGDYEVKSGTEKADRVLESGADMSEYLELKVSGAVDRYLKAIENGASTEVAMDTALSVAGLEPEDGKKSVTDVQRWRAAIDAVDGSKAQKEALMALMSDAARAKYEIADQFGIEARTWVRLREILPQFDADGNGSYNGSEVENAIDALNGNGIMLPGGNGPQQLTNETRAVLWQLFSGSKSAMNNPYSVSMGRKVLEAKEKK